MQLSFYLLYSKEDTIRLPDFFRIESSLRMCKSGISRSFLKGETVECNCMPDILICLFYMHIFIQVLSACSITYVDVIYMDFFPLPNTASTLHYFGFECK